MIKSKFVAEQYSSSKRKIPTCGYTVVGCGTRKDLDEFVLQKKNQTTESHNSSTTIIYSTTEDVLVVSHGRTNSI